MYVGTFVIVSHIASNSYLVVRHSCRNFGIPVNGSARFVVGVVRAQYIHMSIKWNSHHKLIRRTAHIHP